MIYTHVFDPVAMEEFNSAIEWYGERSLAAVDNFRLAVGERIKAICVSPGTYRNTYKRLREASLGKFPFAIV